MEVSGIVPEDAGSFEAGKTVFRNLLKNAIKYVHKRSALWIEVRTRDRDYEIIIHRYLRILRGNTKESFYVDRT